MIPITINNKKHKIKSIDELTTGEFIEVTRIENIDTLKYLAWATKVEYLTVFKSRIPDVVINEIGTIPDITKLKVTKQLLGKYVNRYDVSMIGQRFIIETTKKYKGYDLLVFITAVAFTQSADLGEIEEYMERLYNEYFYLVLPVGNFFFQNLQNGRNTGVSFSVKIKRLTRILLLKNRPV